MGWTRIGNEGDWFAGMIWIETPEEKEKETMAELAQKPRIAKKKNNKVCETCKKEYTAHKANSKYCSIICRMRAYRVRSVK